MRTSASQHEAGAASVNLGPLPGYLGYALRRAQIDVFDDFMRTVGRIGLRPGQFSALLVISRSPGLKQTAVANALGIQGTNFVAMLNELERRGLVERRSADRRSHALHVTREGQRLVDEAMEIQKAFEQQYDEALGAEGHRMLLELLARLCEWYDARRKAESAAASER